VEVILALILKFIKADFNYTVIGFENFNGTPTPLTGFIDVDATSSKTGTITDYDLSTNGREFKFSGLIQQTAGPGEYVLRGNSVDSSVTIQLVLDTTSTLFSGLTTTIDSANSGVPGDGIHHRLRQFRGPW
jgi:hypothetical protein